MGQRGSWPNYLVEGGKVVFWKISDPVNIPRDPAQSVMGQIKGFVEETGSAWGQQVLENLESLLNKFWLVKPKAASLQSLLEHTRAAPQ